MSVVGIVVAKAKSNRFPNKNLAIYKDKPLFWQSVQPLLDSKIVDDVYVATDNSEIQEYCFQNNVDVIWRGPNANDSEEPIFDVYKYAYKSLNKSYEQIVCVMANCPGLVFNDIDRGLKKLKTQQLKELRSYDINGVENGLLIFDTDYFLQKKEISTYVGSIITESKEIHYPTDLEGLEK
jgi:CMP-N,N'-diacetyllegionaminic acid synthase